MEEVRNRLDQFAVGLAGTVIRFNWLVIAASLVMALLIGMGGSRLEFANNYRVFFSSENPELTAFEAFQATYTKNDNFLFVLKPANDDVFTADTLKAVMEVTERGWQIPYAIRVDSLTNFQHTFAIEDDLIVEDLVQDPDALTPEDMAQKREIALNEPLLINQLITPEANATAINVVLQYPEESLEEVPASAAAARDLQDRIEAAYPNLEVYLTGVSMLNNSFAESGMKDFTTLIPLMFLVILIVTGLALRSFWGTVATLGVIMAATMVGMGAAGWAGIKLTPITGSAPIVILTLAVADSIHFLISARTAMQDGMDKRAALKESMRINFLAISITSLTTIVGFLALNSSDAPPFWHLGNISAVGIAAAWLFSITLLPALVSLLPFKAEKREGGASGAPRMTAIADFVIANPRKLLLTLGTGTLALVAFIPTISFNDLWTKYFDERVEFRRDSDAAEPYFGLYPIEFSVPAAEPGGVSDPEFLNYLEAFSTWLRAQPEVVHVYSLTDIMKRLNKNLHGDDPSYYRIPEDRDLAAQYLLLYELSLPYGLDLNDRISIDKSATRLTATVGAIPTAEARDFFERSETWLQENTPAYMNTSPTSASVMFTYIAQRNVESMITGTIYAILGIALIMILTLRSLKLGLLSLIPNSLPILATYGVWAIIIGNVGFSVATVAAISLGIVVDDTVHFMTKYLRAQREKNLSPADSVRYAFRTVGLALIVNTVILTIGFLVLTVSTFKINVDMGLLTAMAIVFALILDFLLLPAILLLISRRRATDKPEGALDAQTKPSPAE